MGKLHVIIHGHFYQPPRENPWTAEIEQQASAAPFHDWNERITSECYFANTRSRIQDGRGRLEQVVNNYEHISFNFGPTLLSYLEEKHPACYRRILKADSLSFKKNGFGNAMAQAYNHMIMPLASARDRQTQIHWGIEDFYARFKRAPRGLWLPETAVNQATCQDLVRAGIEFILLAPTQAQAYRPLNGGDWQTSAIPTDRSYLCRTAAGDLQILFYHAGLSSAVAFEHLLRNAGIFADRIEQAGRESSLDSDHLVMVCSDGESYGHHEKLGDMCLAYLATRDLPQRDIQLTTPAEFLDNHPPQFEVKLKPGKNQQGTAWSCAHGVDRWQADCGCSDGGPMEWSQAWRAGLRKGFDRLAEALDRQFEQSCANLVKDPWAARDDYIKVILGKPLGAAQNFLNEHLIIDSTAEPEADARSAVFRLMEMQLNRMLMYTSCGWFFADLAGLEPVQNLKYAVRAAELGRLIAKRSLDTEMNTELATSFSNLAEKYSALDLIELRVRPGQLSPQKAAIQHTILNLLSASEDSERHYNFRLSVHRQSSASRSGFDVACSRLTVLAEGTREGGTFEVAVLNGSGLRLQAFVSDYSAEKKTPNPDEILASIEKDGFENACQKWASVYQSAFCLADLLVDVRAKVVEALLDPLLQELSETYEQVFSQHEGLLRTLEPLGIALPRQLQFPVGWAGSLRFNELVERALDDDTLDRAVELAKWMEALDVSLDKLPAGQLVSNRLDELLDSIIADARPEPIGVFIRLLQSSRSIGLNVDETGLQYKISRALSSLLAGLLGQERIGGPLVDTARAVVELAKELRLNVDQASAQLDSI
jgi:alpha-amylase/alpha-mannosidase (GH57 family)